jgi:Helix-turn-helix of DDE superfamily endonuclease
MGHVRFTDLQTRPLEVLDLTSLTLDEFRRLVPPFEAAFQAHITQWRFDGLPRTARRYTTDQNCPLPTPEDRLLLILTYLNTYPLQVVQGRLFGIGQSKANQWIHVLLVVLQATRHTLGDAPSRSLQALAQRMGVTEAEATALVVLPEKPSPPVEPPAAAPTPATRSPLSATTGRNDVSSAPRIRLSRRAVIVVRKSATP